MAKGTVIVLSGDQMGKGNDDLGAVLLKAYISQLVEIGELPDTVVFYNTGVNLAVKNSESFNDLTRLQEQGVEMLVCKTCTDYYNITDMISVGKISNMHEIAKTLNSAHKVLFP